MTAPQPADNAWRSSPLLGREALLRSLETRLSTEKRLVMGVDPALRGTTGVGRTRLVAALAQRLTTRETTLLSLSGASPEAWNWSLMQAARQLGFRQTSFRRMADLIGALRVWLNTHHDWLLVADSLFDLDDLCEVVGGMETGLVIAVLNHPSSTFPAGWSAPIPLGALSTDDALEVLRVAVGREWQDTPEVIAATQIINHLERNPLSAELAGRGMCVARLTPEEYLLSLQATTDPAHCVPGLSLLLSLVEDQNPAALMLLAASVAWGASSIPTEVMLAITRSLSSATDPLNLLIECGLLRASRDGTGLEVVARTDVRTLLEPETLQAGAVRAWSALPSRIVRNRLREHVCGDTDIEADPWALPRVSLGQIVASAKTLTEERASLLRQAADAALDLLIPALAQKLLQRVLDHAVQSASRDASILIPLVELGTAYVLGEQFQLARRRWRQAVEFCPVEHPLLTEVLLAVAEIDVNENRFDRASGRLSRVSEICRTLPPSTHHQLLDSQRLYLKAGISLSQGDTAKAREQFLAACEIRKALLPVDHTHLMRNRLMLARTEFLLKNYAASERILMDEIAIRERSSSVSPAELGVACNFLGEQYYLNGRLSDAEPVCERILEIRRSTLTQGHRQIGEMANRLAIIKSARGAYKESDVLFREAITSLETAYGAEHPEVARVLNDLAESLFSQNKYEPARRLLERALSIQEKSLRTNDVRLGRTRCNLAAVYVARGRFAEAVRLYERDVTERQSHKAPDQASLATLLNNLAEALRSLGRYSEAEERLQQSLAIREKMVGPDHPQVAQILNNLGYLHLQLHRFDAARECLQRALRIREACLSAQHPHLATTLGTLAEVHFGQGQYETARPLYSRAIEIYLAAHGDRHPQVATLQVCSARNELRLGHVGRAELMLLRGKSTIQEVLGSDHRMSAKVLLGVAELAHFEKRYEPAFPMLERCLAIQHGTMSSQRLEIAETLRLIADNLIARGLPGDALPRIIEAVEIQRGVLAPQHPEVVPNMLLIGRIQQQLGQAAPAEEAFRFVLDHADTATQFTLVNEARERLPDVLIQAQKYDEAAQLLVVKVESIETAGPSLLLLNTLSQLAGVYYLRSDAAAAAPLMERCVALSDQLQGPESSETAKHLDNLAGVRFLLGQHAEAEPAIQRAIHILEHEHPMRLPALTKARENYVQLLKQTDRMVEADQLEALIWTSQAEIEPPCLSGSHVLDDL